MEACCCSRTAEGPIPPSQDTEFDVMVMSGFANAEKSDVFRTSPSTIRRRQLAGALGLVAQCSSDHYGKKRQVTDRPQQVVIEAVDPDAFNFTKVKEHEIICVIKDLGSQDGGQLAEPVTVMVNVSPLAANHVLFVPSIDRCRPQVLTADDFLCGLRLLARSGRHDFRLVFNSLMGFASVNHFHWHGLYLKFCGFPDGRLPLEKVERSKIAGGITEGRTCVELLCELQWCLRGFVLSSGSRKGAKGERPPADLEALARLAGSVIAELHKNNIPHNVVLAQPADRLRKQTTNAGMAHEEELGPEAVTPEIYIMPRQPEDRFSEDAGFNGAVLEMSGLIIAHTDEDYKTLSEASVQRLFRAGVSLPDAIFDKLLCRMSWMAV